METSTGGREKAFTDGGIVFVGLLAIQLALMTSKVSPRVKAHHLVMVNSDPAYGTLSVSLEKIKMGLTRRIHQASNTCIPPKENYLQGFPHPRRTHAVQLFMTEETVAGAGRNHRRNFI